MERFSGHCGGFSNKTMTFTIRVIVYLSISKKKYKLNHDATNKRHNIRKATFNKDAY